MGVRSGDLDQIKVPLDFIGDTRTIASAATLSERLADPKLMILPVKMQVGGGPGHKTEFGWEFWPQSLYDSVMQVTRDYGRPEIEITENGCSYSDGPNESEVVEDARRIEYHRLHLEEMARAIQDGANVRGYYAWRLMDNFEWALGYSQRFGLVHVDFATQKRIIKESGRWYAEVTAANALPATDASLLSG